MFDTFDSLWDKAKNFFVFSKPLYTQVQNKPQYKTMRDFKASLSMDFNRAYKAIEKRYAHPRALRESLLGQQVVLSKILSPYIYQKKLTTLKEKVAKNLMVPPQFDSAFAEALALFKTKLAEPKVSRMCRT